MDKTTNIKGFMKEIEYLRSCEKYLIKIACEYNLVKKSVHTKVEGDVLLDEIQTLLWIDNPE